MSRDPCHGVAQRTHVSQVHFRFNRVLLLAVIKLPSQRIAWVRGDGAKDGGEEERQGVRERSADDGKSSLRDSGI